jgi:hypothetical protein
MTSSCSSTIVRNSSFNGSRDSLACWTIARDSGTAPDKFRAAILEVYEKTFSK